MIEQSIVAISLSFPSFEELIHAIGLILGSL
jgi:hypothetical protein